MSTQNQIEELPYWQLVAGQNDPPESHNHSSLRRYICNVLERLYCEEDWYLNTNMKYIQPSLKDVAPDVALHIGLVLSSRECNRLKCWRIGERKRPAPVVIFEICSEESWSDDVELGNKPLRYQQMGVKEYFAYDPNTPQLAQEPTRRLRGWRYDGRQGESALASQEVIPDERGWIFSEQMGLYLSPDGRLLRFRDLEGNILLDDFEAAQQAIQRRDEIFAELRAMGINPDDL